MRRLTLLIVLGVSGVTFGAVPTDFDEQLVTTRGSEITSMGWAPDGSGRLFLTAKGGDVWIVRDGAALPDPFVTVSPVYTNSECGLLGIAFDPAFMDNGYVYFFVTRSSSEQQIIRFRAVGDVGVEETLIYGGQDTAGQNHDGGGLAFGPDGKIYWAIGNNGVSGKGTNNDFTRSAAKVSRASKEPMAPAPTDNPFVDGAGPHNDYVWARGLRNPYTMTFRPSSPVPELWVNVVGDSWEQIFRMHAGDHAGYDLENVEPGTNFATLSPAVAYSTHGQHVVDITSISRSGDVVTVTTSGANQLRKGNRVRIDGTTNFNTDYVPIRSVTSTTTFTITLPGSPAATETTGTTTLFRFGNVVAGGTFYDATQFPAAYRGNLFFGDFGSEDGGRIGRVVLADDDSVQDVEPWGSGYSGWTDTSVGPDGALWFVQIGGELHRIVYTGWGGSQGIVVSPLNLRLAEGSRGVVGVTLRVQPGGPVTVNAAASGDPDVTIQAGATLTFDASNWDQPQYVRVAAATDSDTSDDQAAIAFSGPGSETVTVRVTDGLAPPPLLDAGPLVDATPAQRQDARGGPGVGPGGPEATCGCGVGTAGGGNAIFCVVAVVWWLRRRTNPHRRQREHPAGPR